MPPSLHSLLLPLTGPSRNVVPLPEQTLFCAIPSLPPSFPKPGFDSERVRGRKLCEEVEYQQPFCEFSLRIFHPFTLLFLRTSKALLVIY